MGGRQETDYSLVLSVEATLVVRFVTFKGRVDDFGITLVWWDSEDQPHNVRSYDNAHGTNHMHRYIREGKKLDGEKFHSGEAGDAMNQAMEQILSSYGSMIQGWQRQ